VRGRRNLCEVRLELHTRHVVRRAGVACAVVACLACGCAGAAPTPGCAADVAAAPLPGWARSGFQPPDQPVPYVTGGHGEIVGVLFGSPLSAPPAPDRNNKILWVPRDPAAAGPLTITATRADGAGTASQQVPDGPGPSTVDMPSAGCWRFALTWPGHSDQVLVAYQPG
jgi:hypothetical protein